MARRFFVSALTLFLLLAPLAPLQAQTQRLTVKHGISMLFPANANRVDSWNYNIEYQDLQLGIFAASAFPLDHFYSREPAKLKWAQKAKQDKKLRRELDDTGRAILHELTVLDDLNPVANVQSKFTTINKREVFLISFTKPTEAGDFDGQCVGYIIPEKSLFVKAIHYLPKENLDREAKKMREQFFESIKVKF